MYVFHEGFNVRFWDIVFSEIALGVFVNGFLYMVVMVMWGCPFHPLLCRLLISGCLWCVLCLRAWSRNLLS